MDALPRSFCNQNKQTNTPQKTNLNAGLRRIRESAVAMIFPAIIAVIAIVLHSSAH